MSYLTHRYEGEDDMPAHIRSLLTNTSLSIPITNSSTDLTLDPSKKPLKSRVLLSGSGIVPLTVLTKPSVDFASGTSDPEVVPS